MVTKPRKQEEEKREDELMNTQTKTEGKDGFERLPPG
jgi:hypothetical protein